MKHVGEFILHNLLHAFQSRKPSPVFLPGESQGRRSLVGCHLWGRTESDMTDVTYQQQQQQSRKQNIASSRLSSY